MPTAQEKIASYKSVTKEDLSKLYAEFLGAEGEIAIVGDFDVDSAVAELTKGLSNWKAKQPYDELHKSGELKLSRRVETIAVPEKPNAAYLAGTVFPLRDDSADFPPLVMANFVLGGGTLSSRLGDRVRQKDGLSYTVQSQLGASSIDKRATHLIFAICNPTNMEKLKAAVDEEVARLIKDGVTAEELELAKKGFLQRQEVSRAQDSALAGILADNLHTGRTMKYFADLERAIRETTIKEVNEAFRKYIDPQKQVIFEAGDFSKKPAK